MKYRAIREILLVEIDRLRTAAAEARSRATAASSGIEFDSTIEKHLGEKAIEVGILQARCDIAAIGLDHLLAILDEEASRVAA